MTSTFHFEDEKYTLSLLSTEANFPKNLNFHAKISFSKIQVPANSAVRVLYKKTPSNHFQEFFDLFYKFEEDRSSSSSGRREGGLVAIKKWFSSMWGQKMPYLWRNKR